jgi:hypothetical protein
LPKAKQNKQQQTKQKPEKGWEEESRMQQWNFHDSKFDMISFAICGYRGITRA